MSIVVIHYGLKKLVQYVNETAAEALAGLVVAPTAIVAVAVSRATAVVPNVVYRFWCNSVPPAQVALLGPTITTTKNPNKSPGDVLAVGGGHDFAPPFPASR